MKCIEVEFESDSAKLAKNRLEDINRNWEDCNLDSFLEIFNWEFRLNSLKNLCGAVISLYDYEDEWPKAALKISTWDRKATVIAWDSRLLEPKIEAIRVDADIAEEICEFVETRYKE